MDGAKSKRTRESSREKLKRKNEILNQEKKTKSDTTTVSTTTGSSTTDPSLESVAVVGKSCFYPKSKLQESGYRLHECYSEAAINMIPESSKNFMEIVQGEGLHPVASNSSFISAKSDLSDAFQKRIHDLEDALLNQNMMVHSLKKQLGHKSTIAFKSISTETDLSLGDLEQSALKLKDLEKKISGKDKKIRDLSQKVEESAKVHEMQIKENSGLTNQVNLLNRQLKSMFEMLENKNWSGSMNPTEMTKYKNRIAELEVLVKAKTDEIKSLSGELGLLSSSLETKEKELTAKSRELLEYKNRSTLEICKLVDQIDRLQNDVKTQSELLETKVVEAKNSMDDEIINVTQKLEEQYQKDTKIALDKFREDFERLADLPRTAIEKLLKFCEPGKTDILALQKEWDKQQSMLEERAENLEKTYSKEITQLKDSYESKIIFLKTQVEALTSQLKERKDIIDIFENELMEYKSNSSMNLLKATTVGDDLFSLKELYTAEIFSQKQLHQLQIDIFEERVKTLTEEILYHAKNEEINVQELESAKKMAFAFREKYQELVLEWQDKVVKEFKTPPPEKEAIPELDSIVTEFQSLLKSFKDLENTHEERLKVLESQSDDEKSSLLQEVENFKGKLNELKKFQETQERMDQTINELIKNVGENYGKTMESLLLSHVTELSLKQVEISALEKRHIEELDELKNCHEREMQSLQEKLEIYFKPRGRKVDQISQTEFKGVELVADKDSEAFRRKIDDLSTEYVKLEGMFAIKEETEEELNERIKQLEGIIKKKEENCRKELEELMAKYLKVEVLSSAKDDFTVELEEKLTKSEKLLEESCKEIDRLQEIFCRFNNNTDTETFFPDGGIPFKGSGDKFEKTKVDGERLKRNLTEIFNRVEFLENIKADEEVSTNSSSREAENLKKKNADLEKEINKILDEKNKIQKEMSNLVEEIEEKEKNIAEMNSKRAQSPKLLVMKQKVETLENEKKEILFREKMANEEKIKALERIEFLEKNIKELNERIDKLMVELAENKDSDSGEMYSISVQEVRVMYEEERETETGKVTSTVGSQTEDWGSEISMSLNEDPMLFHKKMVTKFRNLQVELSEMINERKKLSKISENLETERDCLKQELKKIREQNYGSRLKICPDDSGVMEMTKKIEKLSEYIRNLTNKLDMMKANNEMLMSESHKHLKHTQNLVSELEEAWSQRYEIEDQLAKVRKENALLNLHRKQLEETNKRISSLVSEGKPSVVSWIKIHETVENIVDEVLALKTSFSDSGSTSGVSSGFDIVRSASELKLMTEALHVQLKNKTVLCDELFVQKETLESELKNLEVLLQDCSSSSSQRRKESIEFIQEPSNPQSKEPDTLTYVLEPSQQNLSEISEQHTASSSTLQSLKKRLMDQAELEEAQFCQNLELKIKELKQKIQRLEECPGSPGDDEECLKSVEMKYEEEVLALTEEFEREVKKLKEAFGSKEKGEISEEDYAKEIDNLKCYFEKKWAEMKERYTEICRIKKLKSPTLDSNSRLSNMLQKLEAILQEENEEEEKKLKMEKFLKEILHQRDEEVRSVREKYREAVTVLEAQHVLEVQKIQSVFAQLKESIMTTLKKEEGIREKRSTAEESSPQHDDLIERIRSEYERKLEEEKKRLCDLLEEAKQEHEREMLALEEFWTEKLSDCETRCALIKATRVSKGRSQEESSESLQQTETKDRDNDSVQSDSERIGTRERRIVKFVEQNQEFGVTNFASGLRIEEEKAEDSLCVSCLSSRSLYDKMEMKTDDDKLDVMLQRDTLEEMVSSMRNIIAKLLTFIGQHRGELSNTSFDLDDTMYKSIHIDFDRTVSDMSVVSNSGMLAMDLSSVFQEIKENSLLNSSDQVRFELERCLREVKKDATCLLAMSYPPENPAQTLNELIKNIKKEKNELEAKVMKVEEMQNEMKKEINMTKDRLSQWERNLEVVSEGYGEEVVEPKELISLSDLKDKLKVFLTEHCAQSPQEINLLEEICKEGDRLQEEWNKEKCDMQQQIDAADKQVHSLKKFLEEQALEREQEREAFDREINQLKESLKAKERDNSLQNRTNREVGRLSNKPLADESVEALDGQVKDLIARLGEMERNKVAVEGEFQNAVKKIWSLREVIQDLEIQLAEVSERECNLKKKVDKLETLIEEQSNANQVLKEELEKCRNQTELKFAEHIKNLEEELIKLREVADQVNPDSLTQLRANLRQIEAVLIKKTKDLEQLHVSSTNVSCSSPSEDVSIRDHLDATRCSTPDEMCSNAECPNLMLPVEEVDRVQEKLARHTRAEEVAMKYIQDLKMRLRHHKKAFEEVQTERDILLEKVDLYLKENSSLKVRLEEQRCNAGLLQKQLNANLESQISRLEVDVEKLNEMCNEKDKQLRDMKEVLENTTKSLKVREAEVLNKSKEENSMIMALKTDLANALNENEKLEERLEKTKEKLRESMKMPALIDSMLEEKNAEIDRLEKEVAKLSSERSAFSAGSKSYGSEEKIKKKIRFSEPESFSENISPISVHCPSDLRNCSETSVDFRHSSFKIKRPVGYSTKIDSVSSIAPLQLSPRGPDTSFNWKMGSPIVQPDTVGRSSPKTSPTKPDFQQMEEISKLQGEIEAKQREISELHLEIDILKRQLVEVNQEVVTAKSQTKEVQNDLMTKEEEIRRLENEEKNLVMSLESLRKKHAEELEELQNKLAFEHGKVEKVYSEIKALEVKKIEIEEAFFSLKEDYNEKINGERKTAEALLERIRVLETKNGEAGLKLAALEKDFKNKAQDSEKVIETLMKEISDLKTENENIRFVSSQKTNAEVQVDLGDGICQKSLALEIPKPEGNVVLFKNSLEELKAEYDKMAASMSEKTFNKQEAYAYAMAVKRLLSLVLVKVSELSKELETHMKKVMECSVDDLAVKVQKELVLSAKLDNQLLSSIQANGFDSKEVTPQPDSLDMTESSYREIGGGDNKFIVPKPLGDESFAKVASLCEERARKIAELEKGRISLEEKVIEQQKIIRLLEESLKKEKERILEEKERCSEDAKIMELLRVNLEKGLRDIKAKEKELKKEKHERMALEKEIESYKRHGAKGWENRKVMELNVQLESQKEKLLSMGKLLEDERKKNQELKLSLEEGRIERISERNVQRFLETDLALLKEQKENFKMELINARKLLHARNIEIGLLKRKINLQEIDIKALSYSNINQQNPSEVSSVASNVGSLADFCSNPESPSSVLLKMKKLNSCVQRHMRDSSDVEEALLYLTQEAEQVKDFIKKLEDSNESKQAEETLVPDIDVERKLWALEKGRLVMDLETLRKENEVLKHDLVETCKTNDLLKQESMKARKESKSPPKENLLNPYDNEVFHERLARLTRKYLRTESYRKALTWQKKYLIITLQEYQRSEEEAWRKIGRKKTDGKRKKQKTFGKFRVVALAAVAIFRMRLIVKRWKRNVVHHVFSLLDTQAVKLKAPPISSVLNMYNEPVNPLSYQTQNIFRQSSSQVLRTPPSRDPGPRSFSLNSKNVPDLLETYEYFQDNIGILKASP